VGGSQSLVRLYQEHDLLSSILYLDRNVYLDLLPYGSLLQLHLYYSLTLPSL